ncbi:MAG: hypothetical protein DRI24_17985 [Deltaproteobacteria bacterium]|nr:MAG: hypothetical protein DRI24_17985 [Deltaproteobacteria bacterium]
MKPYVPGLNMMVPDDKLSSEDLKIRRERQRLAQESHNFYVNLGIARPNPTKPERVITTITSMGEVHTRKF